MTQGNRTVITLYGIAITALLVGPAIIEGQRGGARARGGGGGHLVNTQAARTSIRSSPDVNRNVNRDFNRDLNVNRDVNVDRSFNRDINVNRDIDVDYHYDRWGHPIARGVAAGVALGTTVALLPSSCTTVIIDGIGYSQCGSTWYQPYYSGDTVQYVVVNSPR